MTDDLVKRLRRAGEIIAAVSAHDCINPYKDSELSKFLTEAADRITALIAAGDTLAGFAGHDFACLHYERNDSCDCGYTDAWKKWQEARGEC